jgi:nucleotidyltransferase substrate binding protein (TIGR01987 family)
MDIKYKSLNKALETLNRALELYKKMNDRQYQEFLQQEYEPLLLASRDSVVQRFEYTIELFWKYLRLYLESEKHLQIPTNTPSDTIRSACQARILSEEDAEYCIDMIKARNLTSHIYKEEIAEQLMRDIPGYYQKMKQVTAKIAPENR